MPAMASSEQRVAWAAGGAACALAGCALLRRLEKCQAAGKSARIVGKDFQDRPSTYVRRVDGGVVGLLAYDVCAPLTEDEYNKWLFDVHYHDLMANPHLDKIVLHTVCKDKRAKLSSGASVDNKVEFFRLAELHFRDHVAYTSYIAWFQANVIPPPRTPVGKSAFKFYLLSESESILRNAAGVPLLPAVAEMEPLAPQPSPTAALNGGSSKAQTVLVVGSTGNIGRELVRQLRERPGVTVVEASRNPSGGGAVQLDITDRDSVVALDRKLRECVDHVVICCGASIFGPLSSFDSKKWDQNCCSKLMAVSRLVLMLANGTELTSLRAGGGITVTSGQAARTVNKMWPGIAANNAGLEAMVRCAGAEAPRGVRINALAPALLRETAEKAGLPLASTVTAAEAAAAYLPLIFGDASGQVVDAGTQQGFSKSHHAGQKDGVADKWTR